MSAQLELRHALYPVRLIPTDAGSVRALFPDVPEAVAEGGTEEEALARPKSVPESVLSDLFEQNHIIPPLSTPVVRRLSRLTCL